MAARTVSDVVVVGAGPAGAMAAWRLAARGVTPVLLEEAAAVVPPAGAGGSLLTAGARRLLDHAGLDALRAIARPLASATLSVPGSLRWTFALPGDALSVVSRPRFDRELACAAERAGARVEFERPVVELSPEPGGGWRVRTPRDTRLARHVILATGLRGAIPGVHDATPLPSGLGLALALEARGAGPAPAALQVEFGAHPEAWFWLFPCGGGYTAGLASNRVRVPGGRRRLNAFLDRHGLGKSGVVASRIGPVPGFFAGTRPVRPGLVPAGDQVPAADPLTGLGLEGALRSGSQAAEFVARALLGGGREPAVAMERWRRRGIREARAAARVGEALHRRPVRFLEALRARPARAAHLGRCVVGGRAYAGLFGRVLPRSFERLLQTIERGS